MRHANSNHATDAILEAVASDQRQYDAVLIRSASLLLPLILLAGIGIGIVLCKYSLI